jgi:DNA-binding transcriptional LysR family regulator
LRPALEGVARGRNRQRVSRQADRQPASGDGRAIATTVFAPMIAPFLKAYPEITLEGVSDNLRLDLVSNRFDAGLRIGELIERDMVAIKLIDEIRLVCVAAPGYLEGRATPKTPHDLATHECIRLRWRWDDTVRPWEFEKDGEHIEIAPPGRLTVNDVQNMVMAAVNGVGIAYLPTRMVAPFIADKRLTALLSDWSASFSGVYIYYPSRRQIPAPLQAFIDFARKSASEAADEIRAFDEIAVVSKRARA